MAGRFAALVRHASYHQREGAPSAHQPYDLTAEGAQQAAAAAGKLSQITGDLGVTLHPMIDSSQMLRAWRTADIIAQNLSGAYEVQSFDALAERGVGAAANLTADEITAIVENDPRFDPLPEDWKSDSHFRLPFQGAESLMQSGERVAAHLQRRMEEIDPQEGVMKVFVGHGASFRHAAHFLGILLFEEIKKLSMFHAEPVVLELSSNCQWIKVAGHWKRRKFGEIARD